MMPQSFSITTWLGYAGVATVLLAIPIKPKFAFLLFLALSSAFPGRMLVEPYSRLYHLEGIWLALFSPLDIPLGILALSSVITRQGLKGWYKWNRPNTFVGALSLYWFVLLGSSALNFVGTQGELLRYAVLSAIRVAALYMISLGLTAKPGF